MARESRIATFMYSDATWRHMLVRQPPVLTLGHWRHYHGWDDDKQFFHVQKLPDGLRMGSFYDYALDWVCTVGRGFRVAWDPNQVSLHGSGMGNDAGRIRQLRPRQQIKLTAFTERVDIVMCLLEHTPYKERGGTHEWVEPFLQKFAHPHTKYFDWISEPGEDGN